MPRNEKRNHLLSPLTVDKEQRLSEHLSRNDANKVSNDEHKQIASYTAYLTEKQSPNPAQKRSSSTADRSRREYDNHQRTEKKLIISKLEAENR